MNLYIFCESNRSTVYGIGTYIRELSAALKESDINVCVIYLYTDKPDMETDEKTDGISYWYIPSPVNSILSNDRDRQRALYYRNVLYLLKLHIKDTDRLIFHLNQNKSGKLVEELKKTFDCRVVTTVHYFEWSLNLSGNATCFRKILTSGGYNNNNALNIVVESYRKEKDLFETADHIISLSKNTQQILQDDYQIKSNKITAIYNGLNNICFPPDKQALRLKESSINYIYDYILLVRNNFISLRRVKAQREIRKDFAILE